MATILLVEDNTMTRTLVAFALEGIGHTVLQARDGASALLLVSDARPDLDLVLQDLTLPDISGYELAGKLREAIKPAGVPILALSGVVELDNGGLLAACFDDIVIKPVEAARLIEIVQSYLPGGRSKPPQIEVRRRVLVVDDDPIQLKLMSLRMRGLGFDVVSVQNGAEALANAREVLPDLIVSDVMMPMIDGFQLCVEVRKDARLSGVPVILLTASYIDEADRRLAESVGATAFFLRTPQLEGLREFLGQVFASPPQRFPPAAAQIETAEFEREHTHRVVRQLERQVALNAREAQRSALLAAELSILLGISTALATGADVDGALHDALEASSDAGGISNGALWFFGENGNHFQTFGVGSLAASDGLASFFGEFDAMRDFVDLGRHLIFPSPSFPAVGRGLTSHGIRSAILVPLRHQQCSVGALFFASTTVDLDVPERRTFALGIADQISLATTLASTFAAKAASEERAHASAATLGAIMESISDGIVVCDADNKVTYRNAAGKLTCPDPKRPDDLAKHAYHLDRVTRLPVEALPLRRAGRGERVDDVEIYCAPKGKKARWLRVSARTLLDPRGEPAGAVSVIRDETAAKATQEQLMISDRMASVGALAAGVAHEINNPLAAVVANVAFAQQEAEAIAAESNIPGVADVVDALRDTKEAVEQVRAIVKDLRLFARKENDENSSVDVHRVLESTLRMAWNEIRHRATLVKCYGDNIPSVEANEARLGQVFLNLIVNAAQAIPEGRADKNEIRITTKMKDDKIVVEIADSGPGMPPSVLENVFKPFFTTKAAGVGTGLGLAICHRIVAGLGGEIVVDSTPGRGTTFSVALGAATSPAAVTPDQRVSIMPTRRRVLVVDDDPNLGKAFQRTLGMHDLTVFQDPLSALELLADGAEFDVIFCDVMMPVVTGLEFHAALMKKAPAQAARITFLTGGVFGGETQDQLTKVKNDKLEKPFDPEELVSYVESAASKGEKKEP